MWCPSLSPPSGRTRGIIRDHPITLNWVGVGSSEDVADAKARAAEAKAEAKAAAKAGAKAGGGGGDPHSRPTSQARLVTSKPRAGSSNPNDAGRIVQLPLHVRLVEKMIFLNDVPHPVLEFPYFSYMNSLLIKEVYLSLSPVSSVKVPLACDANEAGEASLVRLVQTFGSETMHIYNAIMSEQRVMFLGHNDQVRE